MKPWTQSVLMHSSAASCTCQSGSWILSSTIWIPLIEINAVWILSIKWWKPNRNYKIIIIPWAHNILMQSRAVHFVCPCESWSFPITFWMPLFELNFVWMSPESLWVFNTII
jgi:hypothetical protein